MRIPFLARSHSSHDTPLLGDCGLKRDSVPGKQLALHPLADRRAAEQLEDRGAMVREVGMQPHPPPTPGCVEAGERIPEARWRGAVDPQITLTAELDRGVAHVDADALGAAAALA